jgi:hypothetical protein
LREEAADAHQRMEAAVQARDAAKQSTGPDKAATPPTPARAIHRKAPAPGM